MGWVAQQCGQCRRGNSNSLLGASKKKWLFCQGEEWTRKDTEEHPGEAGEQQRFTACMKC